MRLYNENLKRAGIVGLLLLSAACSDVAFSPAPNDGKLSNPDNGGGGGGGGTDYSVKDSFKIDSDRPLTQVDVLFVVDNSISMRAEAERLSGKLSSFVDSLQGVDWQIGITTTDISGTDYSLGGSIVNMVGTNSKILTKNTNNYEKVFLDTVIANATPLDCDGVSNASCPSGNEQPLEATRLAVTKRNRENLGFFRSGADYVSIVLSDEDERSTGGSLATTGEDILAEVRNAFGVGKAFTGYGIIIKPDDTDCYNSQSSSGGNYGDFVQHMADITMGETGSICNTDYGDALESIGKRVKKYATSINLSAMPIADTVSVTLTPAQPTITWQVIGQAVRLSDLPSRGTSIDISYERVH